MDYTTIVSFLSASILLTIAPGPDNLFVLTESISKGRKYGIAISIGLVLGVLVHTLAIVIGVAVILKTNSILYTVIKFLGASYLFYLAYLSTTESIPSIVVNAEEDNEFSWFKLISKGWLMNVLNPKVSLFFISFLPQFIKESAVSDSMQILFLGLLFMAQALILFLLLSLLSGFFIIFFTNKKIWHKMKWAKVVTLLLIGLFILVE